MGNTGSSTASFLTYKTSTAGDYVVGVYRPGSSPVPPAAGDSYTLHITKSLSILPSITLAISPASVLEDGTPNLIYTFTRTDSTTNSLTVNYGITGTAEATDYTGATPGTGKTITFLAGSDTATLTIDPTADALVEPDETVILTLATGTDYTIGTTNAVTGTIINDDAAPVFAISSASATEGGVITFTITRTGDAQATQSVTVATSIGVTNTASIPDFIANTGTLSFAQG